jgi:hypothetical protein
MTGSAATVEGGASGSRSRSPGRVREIELSAWTIEYHDTGGDGPVIVLLQGLMDASLWSIADTGGAIVQLLIGDGTPPVRRIVLTSCEAFDNFPPGPSGKTLALMDKPPPLFFGMFMQQMRVRALRRLPIAFGWLTMRGDEATARWMKPVLAQPISDATPCAFCGQHSRTGAPCAGQRSRRLASHIGCVRSPYT